MNNIEILYCNCDIIVLNKPSGVSVTKDRTGAPQLLDLLKGTMPDEEINCLRLIHRLDKETSGLLLLAKTKQAQTAYCQLFENRQIQKTYLAVVSGYTSESQGIIDLPIAPDRKEPNKMRIAKSKGKNAVTEWKLLADFGQVKLLAVYPRTGRTHQIRVHLSAVGLPLAIDPLYSTSRPLFLSEHKPNYHLGKYAQERPLIDRLTLHAYQLVIPEHAGIQAECFIAPLDKKFTATLKMLTKHNPKGPAAWLDADSFDTIIKAKPLP